MAIDRMGHLVLGIKYLFDSHCAYGNAEIPIELAAGEENTSLRSTSHWH